MQAIQTRYIPPTNTKGSRIKAWCDRGTMSVPYPYHKMEGEECHRYAAEQLIARFVSEDKKQYGDTKSMWQRPFVSGGLPTGDWAHVFTS